MIATITVVTTANKHRTFVQRDKQHFDDLCAGLQRYQQLFNRKTLILASALETEIFHPASLTRIEISGDDDLNPLLGGDQASMIRALEADEPRPDAQVDANSFAGYVDFYFQGGDCVKTWVQGPLATTQIERVANLNKIFDQGAMSYTTINGGIGFMNPEAMTRVLIHAGARHLPVDAWKVEST